ncbi:MAG: enoyl-CoA hydratase-related protein, partial [Sphingopyxis sp.]
VGQFVERIDAADYKGLAPADIAARACEAAIADAAGTLRDRVDLVGAIRTFEDSTPLPAKFGKPDKFPLAVAHRLGLGPRTAILEKAGGQSPLVLLADLGERLRRGEGAAALLFGSEAISTVRHLATKGESRDWSETIEGEMEDKGRGLEGLVSLYANVHGLVGAPPGYAMCENARRFAAGETLETYRKRMGRLFAPLTKVAQDNPYASAATSALAPDEISDVGERNRMIASPYSLRMVSRDQVNQGAALLITTVAEARRAGIAESKWIFVHGAAWASEPELVSRAEPGRYPAAELALRSALDSAGKSVADIALFDFYSCFPAPVFAGIEALGLSPDDPRGLTVTGGLPYFGGPGNNYSTHAIATMTERLRDRPDAFGLIGLNGGIQSKYGGIVLSAEPAEWPGCKHDDIQRERDAMPKATLAHRAEGPAHILSYTVTYAKGEPTLGIVLGELEDGRRFLANNADVSVLTRLIEDDPLGAEIVVTRRDEGNRFAFDAETLRRVYPLRVPAFKPDYEHILVRRDGHLLEVTINRPDARNSLPIDAHHELAGVFDAFEADADLWVAIITGAGDRAFCAGADLKTAGRGGVMPPAGFAGLTSRSRTKPIIAAVNGFAFGGGFETALACDLLVMDPAATMALSEVRVGLYAGAGGIVRLPRQLPRKLACELLLTGRPIDAPTAERWGLANAVSEPGNVMEAARTLAREILSVSPTSVRLTMQVLHEADAVADPDLAARLTLDSSARDKLMASEDFYEGTAAFAQKRPPAWKNR